MIPDDETPFINFRKKFVENQDTDELRHIFGPLENKIGITETLTLGQPSLSKLVIGPVHKARSDVTSAATMDDEGVIYSHGCSTEWDKTDSVVKQPSCLKLDIEVGPTGVDHLRQLVKIAMEMTKNDYREVASRALGNKRKYGKALVDSVQIEMIALKEYIKAKQKYTSKAFGWLIEGVSKSKCIMAMLHLAQCTVESDNSTTEDLIVLEIFSQKISSYNTNPVFDVSAGEAIVMGSTIKLSIPEVLRQKYNFVSIEMPSRKEKYSRISDVLEKEPETALVYYGDRRMMIRKRDSSVLDPDANLELALEKRICLLDDAEQAAGTSKIPASCTEDDDDPYDYENSEEDSD